MENIARPPLLLLVDDEPSITITLGELLRRGGYRVDAANSGAEAIDLISRNDYDLVIVDLHMEGVDGMTVLKQLRLLSPLTSAIVLTGYPSLDSAITAMRDGADDYLVKPSDKDELKLALDRGLEKRRLLLAAREIQERLEQTSAELASHLAAIVESSDDAIISKSLDGVVLTWNKGAEQTFGFSAHEAIGKSINILIPPEREHEGLKTLERLRRGEAVVNLETIRMAKGGRRLDVSLTLSPIRSQNGEIIAVSKIARDISEQKLAEKQREELLAREQEAHAEAEAANRAKDQFLAMVSHELRTPLNAILGWVRLLGRSEFDRETVTRALDTIQRNAVAQTQLINDLFDVSRIIAGKLQIEFRAVELSSLIREAVDSMRPAADGKGIRIQAAFDTPSAVIAGDPTRLHQIVSNLLSNAVKFTPRDGLVRIRLLLANSHVEIVVSDSGEGIAPEFLPQVFDRFRQANTKISGQSVGLGLGLSIVRHLVELHGGTVRAESDGENRGATFTVELPLSIAADLSSSGQAAPSVS
jgi:PAS domain S-box-containing protein